MKISMIVALVTLLPLSASAQTIHQYPYDTSVTAYSSPAAWPLESGQCHWRPGNANPDPTQTPQLQSSSIAHTHMEVRAPIYAEIAGNFTVPFDIVLFHVQGHLDPTYATLFGPLINHVVWDTPTGQPPPVMAGDPTGLVLFSGHVTIDLSLADGSNGVGVDVPKRGWFVISFTTRTYFDNGDSTDTTVSVPFYSMLDPSQPEGLLYGGGNRFAAGCDPHSSRDTPVGAIGGLAVRYDTYVPILAPITTAILPPAPLLFGYIVAPGLPPATGMTRFDMDLHNGNPGTLIRSGTAVGDTGVLLPSPFDPAILGAGTHKIAAIRQQDTGIGGTAGVVGEEQGAVLLVVSVTVGGTPPPPPPPPTEVWGNWLLQHGSISGTLRACPDTTGVGCVGVMKQ